MTMQKVFELLDRLELPPGVVNLVNGGREAVDAILDHPIIRAVSFVGSSTVARHVYSRGAAAGKRVQCQGGAKNPVVVLPDADLASASEIVADSAFGCAGQRCLASSVAITVGEAARAVHRRPSRDRATGRVTGYGLDDGVQMGPVIYAGEPHPDRGADRHRRSRMARGRSSTAAGRTSPTTARATSCARPCSRACRSRARSRERRSSGRCCRFTPCDDIDEAIALVNAGAYGNQACLFTTSGASARKFRYEAEVGNVGINVGVAAPMAFFPVQRRPRELLRRPARPGPRRHRVLHPGEGRRRALAEGVVAQVLAATARRRHRQRAVLDHQSLERSRPSAPPSRPGLRARACRPP